MSAPQPVTVRVNPCMTQTRVMVEERHAHIMPAYGAAERWERDNLPLKARR